jgi:hypothetical protein
MKRYFKPFNTDLPMEPDSLGDYVLYEDAMDEINKLAQGNLEAQHRAATENARLRKALMTIAYPTFGDSHHTDIALEALGRK